MIQVHHRELSEQRAEFERLLSDQHDQHQRDLLSMKTKTQEHRNQPKSNPEIASPIIAPPQIADPLLASPQTADSLLAPSQPTIPSSLPNKPQIPSSLQSQNAVPEIPSQISATPPSFTPYSSSGSGVGNVSVHIISEFAHTFELEPRLALEKKGIATLFEFFMFIAKEYTTLKDAFSPVSSGEATLGSAISHFQSILMALKRPGEANASALTLLAVDHFCSQFSLRIRSTLVAAAALSQTQRSRIHVSVSPTLPAQYASTSFNMLPGIKEILSGSVPLPSLVNFVLDRLCYVPDAPVRLDSAKQIYYAIDGSSFTNCMDLMSTITTQFNVCSNWKGSPFSDDSDRIDHFLGICPIVVRNAWIEYASLPNSNVDMLRLSWSEFENKIQTVWSSAMGKERLFMKYGQSPPLIKTARPLPPSAPAPALVPARPLVHPPNALSLGSGDVTLSCKGCNASFIWTADQQIFHSSRGFDNQPRWCPVCKAANTSHYTGVKDLNCYDFAAGKCVRENCRFSHDSPKAPLPVANLAIANQPHRDPADISDDELSDDEGFSLYQPRKRTLVFDSRIKNA